ncbi:pyridoxal 5'-phosphate synthase glutaminase subunit PdxT [Clostridium sp. Marseille-P2415]|uniref:pyridoxal 5'-phosphate synthase glutaminase subunit PdxT n=1 Tax=Clostridium sp. Marseille-P2415 TaxID=1805471 RepID=UPI0009883F19|nr:pyridoxal 5'-phosphate synthase glutaminase subunit PdxT [Clostridium sp. Marseille-P2415]
MKIGVVALQGGFAEHISALNALGISNIEIRKSEDLTDDLDGLILPGGESTVIGKLLHETALFQPIKARIDGGMPVWGTCAGMILLADKISNESYSYFKSIDITVKRNAFGRQLGSFKIIESFKGIGDIPMTFIRAPIIETIGSNVRPLASVNGQMVAAENDHVLVTAFHPELTDDLHVLEYFLHKIKRTC